MPAPVVAPLRPRGVHIAAIRGAFGSTRAGVIVSENWDPDAVHDLPGQLELIVPRDGGYRHDEGNSQAHIRSVMVGTSINIPVRNGRLALGRWQGVMLAELDGPRERTVRVDALGALR